MAKVLIEVTQEDIKKGERGMARCCPIALAVRRALGVEQVVVFTKVDVKGKFIIDSPPKVLRWACDFDDCLPVSPFSFYLDVPAQPEDSRAGGE